MTDIEIHKTAAATKSTPPSTSWKNELHKACRYLDRDFDAPPRLSLPDANTVIAAIELRMGVVTGSERAVQFSRVLINTCRAPIVKDLDIFTTALSAYLAVEPLEFVQAICDPVDGLATTLAYPLEIIHVVQAITERRSRRVRILANARWAKATAEAAQKKQAEDAMWERQRGTAAQRRVVAERAAKAASALAAEISMAAARAVPIHKPTSGAVTSHDAAPGQPEDDDCRLSPPATNSQTAQAADMALNRTTLRQEAQVGVQSYQTTPEANSSILTHPERKKNRNETTFD